MHELLHKAFSHFLKIRQRLDSHREFLPILGRLIFEEIAKAEQNPLRKKKRQKYSCNNDQYVLKFYRKLPLQQRIILHFHLLGGLDCETIADILRLRIAEVLPQLSAARQAFFKNLQKKRIIKPPAKCLGNQGVIFTYPDLPLLEKVAPKIYKKAGKSEDTLQLIALIQKCDILLCDSLAMEDWEACIFEPRQKKLIKQLRQAVQRPPVSAETLVKAGSRWRPVWRTAFALSLFAFTIYVWKFNRDFGERNLAGFLAQNATMPLIASNSAAQNPGKADSLQSAKISGDSTQKQVKSVAADSAHPGKKMVSEIDIHVRPLIQPHKERSAAMTISLRAPRNLNPFVATMRKQDMIGSMATKIKLWKNFFEVTPDTSLYYPHVIQHLAELYMQAAESSADAFQLADAISWFEQYDQILVSFFGDSTYAAKLDTLQQNLRAARIGKPLERESRK